MRDQITKLVGSRRFFIFVLVVLAINAAWIAWSGRYPMAYDEGTHTGIIQVYSERWLPFWSETPPGTDYLGPIERDPSYLYHFLVSLPYRILDNFVQSQYLQTLFLRGLSITVFLAGVVVFRRILLRVGAPAPLTNIVLAVLALLPGTAFMAAQINYDNALFLVSGVAILLALQIAERVKQTGRPGYMSVSLFLAICLLGSLIKFAFLPIFAALVIWLAYELWRHHKFRSLGSEGARIRKEFLGLSLLRRTALVLLLAVSLVMFFERYGVNLIRYQTPTPECDQVMGVEACKHFGPWNRNYELRQAKEAGAPVYGGGKDAVRYTAKHWFKTMSHQLVFSLNGRSDYFKVGGPLLLPKLLIVVVGGFGLVLAAVFYLRLRKKYRLDMLLAVIVIYTGLLWLQNYMDYLHLGHPVAIQGRYIMPVLPLILIIVGLAYTEALRRFYSLRAAFAALCLAILLTQGGAATYIMRSDDRWYWKNNEQVYPANQAVRNVISHWIVDR